MRKWTLRALRWLVFGAALNVAVTWVLAIVTGGDTWPQMLQAISARWPVPAFAPADWLAPVEWGERTSAWRSDEVARRSWHDRSDWCHVRQMRVSKIGCPWLSMRGVVVIETDGAENKRLVHQGFEVRSRTLERRDDRLIPLRPIWPGFALNTLAYALPTGLVWYVVRRTVVWLTRFGTSCVRWLIRYHPHPPRRRATWAVLAALGAFVGVDVVSTWADASLVRTALTVTLHAGAVRLMWPAVSSLPYNRLSTRTIVRSPTFPGLRPWLFAFDADSQTWFPVKDSRVWRGWSIQPFWLLGSGTNGTFSGVELTFWPVSSLLAAVTLWLWYGDRPKYGPRDCRTCGYDLSGLATGGGPVVCPECGRKARAPVARVPGATQPSGEGSPTTNR